MSFILDALKKSESDRQRASGPALFEVKVARTRSALPGWGLVLAALLGVNLALIAWMLLRHPPARGADTAAPPGSSAVAPGPTAAPAAATPPLPAIPSAAAPATVAPPATTSAPAPGTVVAAGGGTPEDYTPAAEPATPSFSAHVQRGTADGVPLYQEAANAPGAHLPQLRLDLHVYSEHPQERFVMINMHKLREGDALGEGLRVEAITPEGALLSYGGSRFLLTRD